MAVSSAPRSTSSVTPAEVVDPLSNTESEDGNGCPRENEDRSCGGYDELDYRLAGHGLKVGDGDLLVAVLARQQWRGHVGISRIFGNVAGVFEIHDSVDRVDPQYRSWRDLPELVERTPRRIEP